MNEAAEILKQLSWFIKPVTKFVLFLFTTSSGYTILLLFLILYLLLTVWNALRVRSLSYKSSSGSGGYVPFHEKIYVAGSVLAKTFFSIISNIPVLISVLVFLVMMVAFSASFLSMDNYLANQQKIKELQTILRHLDQRYKVAELEVLEYSMIQNQTTLNIKFYDEGLAGFRNSEQKIEIRGNDIYFDAIVLNFDYSEIAAGQKRNIVIPYRVFSDQVPQSMGTPLELRDSSGIPFIFHRNSKSLFGIDSVKYNSHLKDLMTYLKDEEAARNAGIRSTYGNAVHKIVKKGQKLIVWIEQTGGLVIKEEEQF